VIRHLPQAFRAIKSARIIQHSGARSHSLENTGTQKWPLIGHWPLIGQFTLTVRKQTSAN